MLGSYRIRPFNASHQVFVQDLEARVQPYRPGDEPEVKAMFARALRAEQNQDSRWIAPRASPPEPLDASWVAEWRESSDRGSSSDGCSTNGAVVGFVGVETFRTEAVISPDHPLVADWRSRGRVAELRRLRVAPEVRRLGIGESLCRTVLEWSHDRYDVLVVNTTTPQRPAIQLYLKLGFRQVGISFVGRYELIWLEYDP